MINRGIPRHLLVNNKLKFHPEKCKVVSIKHRPSPIAMLPLVAMLITITKQKTYCHKQRVSKSVNKNFNFNEHTEILLTLINNLVV